MEIEIRYNNGTVVKMCHPGPTITSDLLKRLVDAARAIIPLLPQ